MSVSAATASTPEAVQLAIIKQHRSNEYWVQLCDTAKSLGLDPNRLWFYHELAYAGRISG